MVQDLIARFPSSTDNFPSGLFDNLQRQIDGVCKDLPIIIPVLEQISPGSSDSTLTAEFRGQLSLDDFAVTVSDVVRVMDILKIKNEISEVWTDYGSTVFGVEVGSEMAPGSTSRGHIGD